MENIKNCIVTLKNGKSYFVIEEVSDNFDIYNLILNVEDESDVKIVMQEVIDGKVVLSDVKDLLNISYLKGRFRTKIEEAREGLR